MFKRFNRHYFDLLWVMTQTEFTARYKRAIFGFLWIFLNPLFQMVIIGAVFSYFIKIPNYYLFLLSGLLPWQFFSSAFAKGTSSFVNSRSLLQKTPFPRELIPLSIIGADFMHLLISMILFLILSAILLPLTPLLFLLIPALIYLFIFTIGITLTTASLNVRFRDVGFIINTITTLWFYATPILYSLETLSPALRRLLVINPLTTPLLLLHTAFFQNPLPTATYIIANISVSVLAIVIGVVTFKKLSPNFVDWL